MILLLESGALVSCDWLINVVLYAPFNRILCPDLGVGWEIGRGTVQAAKRLYPSRLRTWNFASHVTFLRGFCEEVAWVLRGSSVSFAKFCEIVFVERGKQA